MDELRIHLASEHALANAGELSDDELREVHEHEHTGPGTIRSHDPESLHGDQDKAAEVMGFLHVAHPATPNLPLPVFTDERLPQGVVYLKTASDKRSMQEFIQAILDREKPVDEHLDEVIKLFQEGNLKLLHRPFTEEEIAALDASAPDSDWLMVRAVGTAHENTTRQAEDSAAKWAELEKRLASIVNLLSLEEEFNLPDWLLAAHAIKALKDLRYAVRYVQILPEYQRAEADLQAMREKLPRK